MLDFLPLSVEADVLNLGSFVYCKKKKKFVFKGKCLNGKISPGKVCKAGTREGLSLQDLTSDFFEGFASQPDLERNTSKHKECPDHPRLGKAHSG